MFLVSLTFTCTDNCCSSSLSPPPPPSLQIQQFLKHERATSWKVNHASQLILRHYLFQGKTGCFFNMCFTYMCFHAIKLKWNRHCIHHCMMSQCFGQGAESFCWALNEVSSEAIPWKLSIHSHIICPKNLVGAGWSRSTNWWNESLQKNNVKWISGGSSLLYLSHSLITLIIL